MVQHITQGKILAVINYLTYLFLYTSVFVYTSVYKQDMRGSKSPLESYIEVLGKRDVYIEITTFS